MNVELAIHGPARHCRPSSIEQAVGYTEEFAAIIQGMTWSDLSLLVDHIAREGGGQAAADMVYWWSNSRPNVTLRDSGTGFQYFLDGQLIYSIGYDMLRELIVGHEALD